MSFIISTWEKDHSVIIAKSKSLKKAKLIATNYLLKDLSNLRSDIDYFGYDLGIIVEDFDDYIQIRYGDVSEYGNFGFEINVMPIIDRSKFNHVVCIKKR